MMQSNSGHQKKIVQKILSNIHIKICIKLMQTQQLTQLQRPMFEHIIGYNTFLSAIEIWPSK